ncbi:MAG TPA: TIGR03085 family protein, partial [Mycobacteriales bacterium]|nr:TIGR03085 family protein [Mycobacteriales bacterium]
MTSWARGERAELVDLLRRLGPDAPTACTGWTTA